MLDNRQKSAPACCPAHLSAFFFGTKKRFFQNLKQVQLIHSRTPAMNEICPEHKVQNNNFSLSNASWTKIPNNTIPDSGKELIVPIIFVRYYYSWMNDIFFYFLWCTTSCKTLRTLWKWRRNQLLLKMMQKIINRLMKIWKRHENKCRSEE